MPKTHELTADRLREVLLYDPASGTFTWRKKMSSRAMPGQAAGTTSRYGYVQIRIDGVIHRASRLAWLYMTGAAPTGDIDHINRRRADNRWCNLRDVPPNVNRQNLGPDSTKNKHGKMGVALHEPTGLYAAQIKLNGKHKNLGYFKTVDEANEAYIAAKRRLHPGCTI